MISQRRILQLRFDDVERKIDRRIYLCDGIINGNDNRVHGLGAMLRWMDRHPGETKGFRAWQSEIVALAIELRATLSKRKARAVAAAEALAQNLSPGGSGLGDDDLDRLEAALQEASAGPWKYEEHWRFNSASGEHEPTVTGPRLEAGPLDYHEPLADDGMPYYKANLRFAVEAKNAMGKLLRELRERRLADRRSS